MKGQLAIVTGSGNGIGKACALRLAGAGAQVALVDIEGDALAEVAREIREAGGTAQEFVADLSDQKVIKDCFAEIAKKAGPAIILVNNVGRGARDGASKFEDADTAFWNFLIDINLKAALACTQHVIKGMKAAGGGRIVNISSDSAFYGSMIGTAYAAAKAGVVGFTRSLARELGSANINVNAVAPGYIFTRATGAMPKDVVERAIKDTILGRLGEPDDIANAVYFFASDQGKFITGQTLLVNGGRWFN